MQDGFAIAIRIPSFENSFWVYLPDSIITVDVKHLQPTQAIFSHFCSTPSLEAPIKTSHMHCSRLVQASSEKC
jgi:hypothetical protein